MQKFQKCKHIYLFCKVEFAKKSAHLVNQSHTPNQKVDYYEAYLFSM